MATAPDRVDPVFGDALAGDGGMTDPVATGPRREKSFDVFPDALSALPLPALTFVVPPTAGAGVPVAISAAPAPIPAVRRTAVARPAAAFPPPGPLAMPAAGRPAPARPVPPGNGPRGVLAPSSGSRPVAGFGYVQPAGASPAGAPGVVRPPAYLPQNPGWAQVRAAVQQARGSARPPVRPGRSPTRPVDPSAARYTPAARRGKRASSAWSLIVFAVIVLVSTGLGQRIIEAVTDLWSHR